MKGIPRFLFVLAVLFLIVPVGQYAQGTKYCKMLGKTLRDVKKTYGTPTFQNLDEATMQWVFYQIGSDKITFVGNDVNIFQVQVDVVCGSEKETKIKLDSFLNECGVQNLKIDTVRTDNFKITGDNFTIDLYLSENLSRSAAGFKYKALLTEPKKEN